MTEPKAEVIGPWLRITGGDEKAGDAEALVRVDSIETVWLPDEDTSGCILLMANGKTIPVGVPWQLVQDALVDGAIEARFEERLRRQS